MGKTRRQELNSLRSSKTLPSSPSCSFSSSSSSSDFEFSISVSPLKSSTSLCPADELFYKGQLLPLLPSPRISMVRTLLLSSSDSSSSSTSRDSTASTSSFSSDLVLLSEFPPTDSSRPSSVNEDEDELKKQHNATKSSKKYFSFSRFFRKDNNQNVSSSMKRMSDTAREVIKKYLKKVKPLYEKLSQKQQQQQQQQKPSLATKPDRSETDSRIEANVRVMSHSLSGNLKYPRKRSHVSSCPSSIRSSPSHTGALRKNGIIVGGVNGMKQSCGDSSSMDELQSAIQGAIAHCKNSMLQKHNKQPIL